MATSHDTLTDEEFAGLLLLDFEPSLPCDHEHHDGRTPTPARWRLLKRHASDDCGWAPRLYCDGCLNRLYGMGDDPVECTVCGEAGTAVHWWRLLGRL